MQAVPLQKIMDFAKGVLARAGAVDAIYFPCPQWQASQIVDAFERETGTTAVAYLHASSFVGVQELGHPRMPSAVTDSLLASLAETR